MTAALVAPAIAVAKPTSSVPVLNGDGKHDDTLALTALLNGDDIVVPANAPYVVARLQDGSVTLIGGEFLVHRSVESSLNRMAAGNVLNQVILTPHSI